MNKIELISRTSNISPDLTNRTQSEFQQEKTGTYLKETGVEAREPKPKIYEHKRKLSEEQQQRIESNKMLKL